MKIINATYGTKDVTEIVNKYFINEKIQIFVSNEIFGDPNFGVLKKLVIKFDNGLEISEIENNNLIYPKLVNEKLGIFYTNNNNPKTDESIKQSLKSIEIASLNKADIITCVWNKIINNPFTEIIAQTKNPSHLNQILQILQTLLFAKKQNANYKYVSFLEHDCLYSENYFDYEEFESDSICNINYIGLCEKGWQNKNQEDRPLSQVTMKFEKAIDYFQMILPNAILTNSGSLEPWWQDCKKHFSIKNLDLIKKWNNNNWSCKNPSVHINHGYHFTSHYRTFSHKTYDIDNYWGTYKQYSHLFIKK